MAGSLNYHVNKGDKEKYDIHVADKVIHITGDERSTWNAIEAKLKEYTNTMINALNNDLAKVAKTGQYVDLLGKPTKLPADGGHADTATSANNANTVGGKTVSEIISTININANLAILTGAVGCVRSGNKWNYSYVTTLPIPAGFTEAQCKFYGYGVSYAGGGEYSSAGVDVHIQTSRVSYSSSAYGKSISYIVIGVK